MPDESLPVSGEASPRRKGKEINVASDPAKQGNHQDTHGQDANSKLFRRLLSDVEFLDSPLSEGKTAAVLGVNKSALREAVIGFVRAGWLVRSEDGVCRDDLKPSRLVQLFAMRLLIELTARRRVMAMDEVSRSAIFGDLKEIVDEQDALAKNDGDDQRINWFRKCVEFHTAIVQMAGLSDIAKMLDSIFWQLRIGARISLEYQIDRTKATEEHLAIAEGILHGKDDEKRFIDFHIQRPFFRALGERGRTHSMEYWRQVINILPLFSETRKTYLEDNSRAN